MEALLDAFFNDVRVQVALLLVALDFALGVLAALKGGSFRLSYVGDFLRADVLGKVLPFFVLYGGYKYAAGADIVIPGFDLEVVMNAAWVVVLGALGGSLLSSLRDLGLSAPDVVAGRDPATPDV
jgi:hypothetical protein